MAGADDSLIDFEGTLTPEERQRYRSRAKEIVAESTLVAELRRRRRINPSFSRILAQMHAQLEMLRIRSVAEMKKLDDPGDRKATQARTRYLDGALRRSAKMLGLP